MGNDPIVSLDELVKDGTYDMAVMHPSGIQSDRFTFHGIGYVGNAVPIAVFQKQGPLGPDDDDGLVLVNEEGLANRDTPIVRVED